MAARLTSLSRAVSAAISELTLGKRDAAAAALAKRYAALIDRAEETAAELDALRPDDESTADAVRRLRARVDSQAVASDLGPKLLAALAALGATPQARAAALKGGVTGGPTRLDVLRARRQA